MVQILLLFVSFQIDLRRTNSYLYQSQWLRADIVSRGESGFYSYIVQTGMRHVSSN